jgi:hypothetical protein
MQKRSGVLQMPGRFFRFAPARGDIGQSEVGKDEPERHKKLVGLNKPNTIYK